MLNQHFRWNKARMDCLVGMVIALFFQGVRPQFLAVLHMAKVGCWPLPNVGVFIRVSRGYVVANRHERIWVCNPDPNDLNHLTQRETLRTGLQTPSHICLMIIDDYIMQLVSKKLGLLQYSVLFDVVQVFSFAFL